MFDTTRLKQLMEQHQVDLIIGYGQGSLPYMTKPLVCKTAAEVDTLVFNHFANHNLWTYHHKIARQLKQIAATKAAVLIKPCDGMTLAELLKENRINRTETLIVSLPCQGIINTAKLLSYKNDQAGPVTAVQVEGNNLILRQASHTTTIELGEVLEDKCLSCRLTSSPVYDEQLGEATPPCLADEPAAPKAVENEAAYWESVYNTCIRCGACKQVCPMCYCKSCVLDNHHANLLSGDINPEENGTFLMVRTMHLAGRCTHCGRCTQVCPVGIQHDHFHRPLSKFVTDAFDYQPGEAGGDSLLAQAQMEEKLDFMDK